MLKKMMLLAMAVGAMAAFAAPAAQAEATTLTDSSGTLQPTAGFTATSTDLTTTLEGGAVLSCPGALGGKVTLHMEVVSNHPLVVRQVGAATTQNCFLFAPGAHEATITDGTIEGELNFATNEATANASFGADVPSLSLECELEGSVTAVATTNTSTIDIPGSALAGFPAGCPGGEIHGTFELETSNGDPITID